MLKLTATDGLLSASLGVVDLSAPLTALVGPWEVSDWNDEEAVAAVGDTGKSVVPSGESGDDTEPPTPADPSMRASSYEPGSSSPQRSQDDLAPSSLPEFVNFSPQPKPKSKRSKRDSVVKETTRVLGKRTSGGQSNGQSPTKLIKSVCSHFLPYRHPRNGSRCSQNNYHRPLVSHCCCHSQYCQCHKNSDCLDLLPERRQ